MMLPRRCWVAPPVLGPAALLVLLQPVVLLQLQGEEEVLLALQPM